LVVDGQGNPVYGQDGDGYPLDSRGNSFTAANYYDMWASNTSGEQVSTSSTTSPQVASSPPRAEIAAPAAPATRASRAVPATPAVQPALEIKKSKAAGETTQRMQTVAPDQVDKYGVKITDAIGNPIFGMDPSGWYAIDSAGDPWKETRWVEIDVPQQVAGPSFNAVLIIDISRSMLARDLEVSDVETTIHGIKRAMPAPKIQYFLNQFKEGTMVPRRMGAALATISFLAEKMTRGPGDKVAVIRFADMAETLDFDGAAFMDGEHQEMLENTAVGIVEKIGNSYGQATEMGKALYLALELVKLMGEMDVAAGHEPKPAMCMLLTDGYPTDVEYFKSAVEAAKKISNLTLNIVGLGSPDKELLDLMKESAHDCGGELIMPDSTGKLLAWYVDKAARFTPVKRLPST
ncbi:MAG: VWA domain-containing protein, partial [Candidatus Lokiarchaeota archaeon]|nr:VWA domain-containing protein [Candidatus Lokiarchaeota archaeon]